jgi:hypothetical protein
VTENLQNRVLAYSGKAIGFVEQAEPRLTVASVASGVPSEIMCFLTGRGAKKLPGRSRPISAIKRLATASGAVIQILLLRRL